MTFKNKWQKIFILIFLVICVSSQYLKSISNCLSDCRQCSPSDPSSCLVKDSDTACVTGFMYGQETKLCVLRPSFESNYVSYQFTNLTEIPNQSQQKQKSSWKDSKQTQCSFIDSNEQLKYFNVIGLFEDVSSISKQFQISEHHQNFILSFNLIRNNWAPNNDFLIIDIQAGDQLISSNQISYDMRQIAKSNNLISCNNEALSTEKFHIKIHYRAFQSNKIRITFTGFLFNSVWGISNVKFIPGCQGFTVYNKLTQNCDFCNVGFYPEYKQIKTDLKLRNQMVQCKKCPFSCVRCLSVKVCNSCIKGYKLVKNTCVPDTDFVYIKLDSYKNTQQVQCKVLNDNFFKNKDNKNLIEVESSQNQQITYTNGFLQFQFVYNTLFQKSGSKISIQIDGIVVSQISGANLTNKGFQACHQNSKQRFSLQKYVIPVINASAKSKILFKGNDECQSCKFGIRNLQYACLIKSLIPQSVPEIQSIVKQEESVANNTEVVPQSQQQFPQTQQVITPPTQPQVQLSVIEQVDPKIQVISPKKQDPVENNITNEQVKPQEQVKAQEQVKSIDQVKPQEQIIKTQDQFKPIQQVKSAQQVEQIQQAPKQTQNKTAVQTPVQQKTNPFEQTIQQLNLDKFYEEDITEPQEKIQQIQKQQEQTTQKQQNFLHNLSIAQKAEKDMIIPEQTKQPIQSKPIEMAEPKVQEKVQQAPIKEQTPVQKIQQTPQLIEEPKPIQQVKQQQVIEQPVVQQPVQNQEVDNKPVQQTQFPVHTDANNENLSKQLKQNPSIQHISLSRNGRNFLIVKINSKNSTTLPTLYGNMMIKLTSDELDKDGKPIITYVNEQKNALDLQQDFPSSEMSNTYFFEMNTTFLNKNVELINQMQMVAATGDNQTVLVPKNKKVASFAIQRFDDLEYEYQQILKVFQKLFSIFAWVIILVVFFFTFMGKSFLVEQTLISMQKLFLTIYIYTSYLPASILNSISGLRRLQNLDIFIQDHILTIQETIFGNMIQDSPLRFTLFHKDINFTRNFIPILLFIIIVVIWYFVVKFYNKFINKEQMKIQENNQNQLNVDQNGNSQRNYTQNNGGQQLTYSKLFNIQICHEISKKTLNYFIQILKLTYLPVLFLSLKQLHNFAYPSGSSGQGLNTAFCVIMFILRIVFSIVLILWASKQYFRLQYDKFVKFFTSIYFKKIPKDYLPTQHHRINFPILRQLKVFLFAFLIAIFGDYALPISIVLIFLYAGQMVYAWYYQIYQDSLYYKFEVTETILFCTLFVIHLLLNVTSKVISTNGYLAFGYIYMAVSLVLIINSFSKSSYLAYDHFKKIKKCNQTTVKPHHVLPLQTGKLY